jgi:hypothetical protein
MTADQYTCQRCETLTAILFEDPTIYRKLCKKCLDIVKPTEPSMDGCGKDNPEMWDSISEMFDPKPMEDR